MQTVSLRREESIQLAQSSQWERVKENLCVLHWDYQESSWGSFGRRANWQILTGLSASYWAWGEERERLHSISIWECVCETLNSLSPSEQLFTSEWNCQVCSSHSIIVFMCVCEEYTSHRYWWVWALNLISAAAQSILEIRHVAPWACTQKWEQDSGPTYGAAVGPCQSPSGPKGSLGSCDCSGAVPGLWLLAHLAEVCYNTGPSRTWAVQNMIDYKHCPLLHRVLTVAGHWPLTICENFKEWPLPLGS